MTIEDYSSLRCEAAHLHLCLFGEHISSEISSLYISAHETLRELIDAPFVQLQTLRVIVEEGLDATSIEPWFRDGKKRHLLSSKLLLLSYLAECSGNRSLFSRCGRHQYSNLLTAGFLGVVSLLRGYYLKSRYGLV